MKKIILITLFLLLLYTRFVGLNWGLPYPMHPDERNMANALQQLSCKEFSIKNCFNPHFFAYGQFPLYLGYLLIQIYHFLRVRVGQPINFEEAVMSLRVISAVASIINIFVLLKIINLLINSKFIIQKSKLQVKSQNFWILNCTFAFCLLIFAFSPYFIQFSHFGTTESLLMLLYSLIIYFSLQLFNILKWKIILFLAFLSGLSVATKMSAVIFMVVPIVALMVRFWSRFTPQNDRRHRGHSGLSRINKRLLIVRFLVASLLGMTKEISLGMTGRVILIMIGGTLFFALLFSPHNLISFNEFKNSINYESAVALGKTKVFYTRQFEGTTPIVFQLMKIFPYALGWPQYLLAILGFFLLSYKDKRINLLRLAFLIYFIPTAFLYAKWTRFMAPLLPIASVFAALFIISKIKNQKSKLQVKSQNFWILNCTFAFCLLIFALVVPGLAYLSIYRTPDVRFAASEWIYKNIPENSYVLSETANVVDIPVPILRFKTLDLISQFDVSMYNYISFNFYNLDKDYLLQQQLNQYVRSADYIFVPSRRIFKNHPQEKYPQLSFYYQRLFSGELGFKKVAEFSSYPKIRLFGKTLIEFPDEDAEETWTVFDHPVIRIFKKNSNY